MHATHIVAPSTATEPTTTATSVSAVEESELQRRRRVRRYGFVVGERVRCEDSILARVVQIDRAGGLLKILVAAAASAESEGLQQHLAAAAASTLTTSRWVWTTDCQRDLRSALKAASSTQRDCGGERRSIRFRPGPPDERIFLKRTGRIVTRRTRAVKKQTKKQRKREQREQRRQAVEEQKKAKRDRKEARRAARAAKGLPNALKPSAGGGSASDTGDSGFSSSDGESLDHGRGGGGHANIVALSPMIRGGRPALEVEMELPEPASRCLVDARLDSNRCRGRRATSTLSSLSLRPRHVGVDRRRAVASAPRR